MIGNEVCSLEGTDELLRKLRGAIVGVRREKQAALLSAAEPLLDRANGMAPDRLIRTEVEHSGPDTVVVNVGFPKDKWHWRFLETGATAHEIKARNASTLYFEGDSGPVFVKVVHHPGMAARPFLRPAYDETRREIEQRLGDYLRKVIDR